MVIERYEIIETNHDADPADPRRRAVVAANLSHDNAHDLRNRFRINAPQGASVDYRLRRMQD